MKPDKDFVKSWQGQTSMYPVDFAETPASRVFGLAGSYGKVCVIEDTGHSPGLIKPVVAVVLHDAKTIYPNTAYV